jgi:hypothetical protein
MSDAARIQSMQLLAQDFGDILTALRTAQDTKGHEQRSSTRMEVQAQVKVLPYKGGTLATPFTCMTRDLSFKGVGLLQSRQAGHGSQFVVMLPKRDGKSMSILCTVMYCRTLADGIYNIGATFNRIYDVSAALAVDSRNDGSLTQQPGGARPDAGELDRIRQSILG